MRVEPFSVGPILGACTHDTARLFGRAAMTSFQLSGKAMLGRVRWRVAGQDAWQPAQAFRLNTNFDGSGVVVLHGLTPGALHEYQAGWVTDPDVPASQLDWRALPVYRFRSAPAASDTPTRLLLGSCSYRFFDLGGLISDDRADKTFKAMHAHQHQHGPVDFTMLCGDQVYADPLNRLGALSEEACYLQLYRRVFGQPGMRELMANTPTYMILDDHEIEDNWPAHASSSDHVGKFPAAIKAYQIYQASHSPAMPLDPTGCWPDRDPDHLWYHFSHGCADVFVMDVRTERQIKGQKRDLRMISEAQEQALIDWLARDPQRVKLIVSPVVVFPDNRRLFRRSDAWEGFVHQRRRILDAIRHLNLRRVAFLSGDVHASLVAALHTRGRDGKPLTVHNVVSSGLFWPSALMAFRWYSPMIQSSGRLTTGGLWSWNRYRVTLCNRVYSRDAFARIEVSPEQLRFRLFDRRGDALPAHDVDIDWG